MADARSNKSQSKGKRGHSSDPKESSSGDSVPPKAARVSTRSTHSKSANIATSSREETRRHKAMEKAFQKAASEASRVSSPSVGPSKSPAFPTSNVAVPSSQIQIEHDFSPDQSTLGENVAADASSVFPAARPLSPIVSIQAPPRQEFPEAQAQTCIQGSEAPVNLTPALAELVSVSIRQGIAEGLQQRASSEASSYVSQQSRSVRAQMVADPVQCEERADSPENASQGSLSEGEIAPDQDLSEDEGLEPDQPSFIGLFKPQLFRSLLFKAQNVTGLGISSTPSSQGASTPSSQHPSSSLLFQEPSIRAEVVPAPKLFSDVVQRQWSSPSSGPVPNGLDKRFYNMASDFANILQVPSVDAPIVALSSASPLTGPSEEFLRPEDKKLERSLVKDHQASAWSIQASSAASFFNRASILWLRQLQERLPPSDMRSHQDINKILAAVEFSADATLNAARFSAKAIGASVTSRRLLWLRQWQADVRNKWRLASAPFSGNYLFGPALDPLLIETKDHRKILPALSRRSDPRQQGSFRSHSFRSDFSSFQSRPQRYPQPRGGQQQDFQEHVRGQSPLDSSSSPVLGMVDLSGSCSGMPVQSASTREHHHGREPLRMGGSPGVSAGPRAVVGPGEGTSHQHLGAQSHLPSSSQVRSSPSRSGCLDQNRQRSCQGPHQPARRDPLQGSHEGGISSLQVGGESLGIHPRLSHLRVSKCSGGRSQSIGGGPDGVEPRSTSVPGHRASLRPSSSGPLRVRIQPPASEVLHEISCPGSRSCGCLDQPVALWSSSLCFPISSPHLQGHQEAVAGTSRAHPSGSLLAQTTVVCGSDGSLCCSPLADPGRQNISVAGPSSSSRLSVVPADHLEVERFLLSSARVPSEIISMIQASRRGSTNRIYNATWMAFSAWCRRKKVLPTAASILDILGFLHDGFISGLSPNTLRRQISAISSILTCGTAESVSTHPLIRSFLRGATNLRPPAVHRFPTWDLNKVLLALTGPPFEPLREVSLKFLSFKAAFLVAITSARRISELAALSVRQDLCIIHPDRVILRLDPAFIPKINSTFHRSQEIILPNFCPFPRHRLETVWHKLDVRRALKIYISRTSSFRRSEALFVSFQPQSMGSKVSSTTLGRWLRASISLAYEAQSLPVPRGVTAHSTRSAATSAAWSTQASLEEVCRAATWTSPSPFIRHYRLDVYASAEASFGRRVLQRVSSQDQERRRPSPSQ
ncbi:uncharacterized protein LOC117675694 [Pantherophis guttatus]|uniref:Uncharacterized protein LOC117675694 n=1 Tax=Pantherophis guttatus TaxID=94885 RepID=A0A6P9D556_PANGU|nr:uncharacterized protein LOC117675694 [Pantherophis guttatus]